MLRKRRLWLIVIALVIGVVGVSAQDGATADPSATPIFADVNISDGFVLDPTLVTLIAGGPVPANVLQEGCAGHISAAPSVALNFNETDVEMLRLFFFSDDDSVLAVVTPSGEVICNDDAASGVLDASVDIANPEAGRYAVFVGNYSSNQLAPGFLVATSLNNLSTNNLNLGELVTRALGASTNNGTTLSLPMFDTSQIDTSAAPVAAPVEIAAGFGTTSIETSGGGAISAVSVDSIGNICNGNIASAPSAVVTVTDELPFVRIFFNSTSDSTLMIFRDDGAYACNDDSNGQLNPSLEFTNVAPGTYTVYIGSFDALQPVSGTLVITEDSSVQPETLGSAPLIAPAAGGGE